MADPYVPPVALPHSAQNPPVHNPAGPDDHEFHRERLTESWAEATDLLAAGVAKLHAAGMDTDAAGKLCLQLFTELFGRPHPPGGVQ